MFEKEKKQVLDAALEIKKCNLVSLSGGNISVKVAEDKYLVTPSGMISEDMVTDDGFLLDGKSKALAGSSAPCRE